MDQVTRGVRIANVARRIAPPRDDAETVQSVDRALAIVELLLRAGAPRTVREVAAGTGINRTTAHRLLASLHRRGWIERVPDSGGFRPSLRYLALVRASLDDRDFLDEVRPTMERLAQLSRETVHLGVLDNHEILHIAKVDSPETVGVSSRIGTRATPHVTGLGKALLAAGSDAELETYITHAPQQPSSSPETSPIDAVSLRADIHLTRARGYSIDEGESSPGVRCLAVAVRGVDNRPIFALSLTGPSGRFTPERLEACVPEMLTAARTLTAHFGGDGVPRPEADA
ncbi:MAG: IclR family transcriptional regulator [Chloroflexia bacterium]|nr:IclR family transcriptional regulator [Chloroflexia bacterium]